jgi:DNA topoisomerase-1
VAVPDNTELSQLTVDFALQLLSTPTDARVVGEHNGEEVTVKVGPYGPYAKVGARSVSLPAGTDVGTVSMADIEPLLAFPRSLGADPASGEEVVLKRGRYGIYVEKAGETRPVPADTDPAWVTLDHALELLARPKKGRGKR